MAAHFTQALSFGVTHEKSTTAITILRTGRRWDLEPYVQLTDMGIDMGIQQRMAG